MTKIRAMLGKTMAVLLIVAFAAGFAWHFMPTPAITTEPAQYLDMHVHTAGLGYGNSDAFINRQMADSYKFSIYLAAMGVSEAELMQYGDGLVISKIAAAIDTSQRVSQAIVLAMDGVIGTDGELDRERTQIYVPNEFVAQQVAQHPNLEFGASINPDRPDALARLREAHAMGARLVKWIPNIMLIDPANPSYEAFYLEMAALGLPLLSHTGQERSFADAEDSYGDPVRLSLALDSGVTVIAAHIASSGLSEGADNFARIMPMFAKYPNLYTDVSSLTQVNRLNYLARALKQPGVTGRMLYGSDWPLQFFPLVSPVYHLNHIDLMTAKGLLEIDNVWDRDVMLKESIGVPQAVFQRTREVLQMPESKSHLQP